MFCRYFNDWRAHGTETPAGGAVIGQLEHVTHLKWREKRDVTAVVCLSSQILDNSLNYHHNGFNFTNKKL